MRPITREQVEEFFPDEIAFSDGTVLARQPILTSEAQHYVAYRAEWPRSAFFHVPTVLRDDQRQFPWPPERWRSEVARAEEYDRIGNVPFAKEPAP